MRIQEEKIYSRHNLLRKKQTYRRQNKWGILLDLPIAFGGVNRNKLWLILYEKGTPKPLIKPLLIAIITPNYVVSRKGF